jgi:hypothetical protein
MSSLLLAHSPSVFWVAQLVERQTVITSGLKSEGPWFEPMSRSFFLGLAKKLLSLVWVFLGSVHVLGSEHVLDSVDDVLAIKGLCSLGG